jgi:hypothetical protein
MRAVADRKPALDERIAEAFVGGTSSGLVAELIAEAQAAVVAAGEAFEAARTRALDPGLPATDVSAARCEMEDASFRREVKRQEEEGRRRAAYDAALVERDALANELAAVYPVIADQLASLASRVAASDATIERVNQRLPDGATAIPCAELVARQLSNFFDGTADIPRITKHMRLPAFRYSGRDPYAWPLR